MLSSCLQRGGFVLFLSLLWLQATQAFSLTKVSKSTAALIPPKVYIFGGSSIDTTALNEIYSLDLSIPFSTASPPWVDLTNSSLNNKLAEPRVSGVAFPSADGKTMYVESGENMITQAALSQDLLAYDTQASSWAIPITSGIPPPQREGHAVAFNNSGFAFLWGGVQDSETGTPDTTYNNNMYLFDTKALVWSQGQTIGSVPAPAPRVDHTLSLIGNKIYVLSGLMATFSNLFGNWTLSGVPFTDIWIYDTMSDTWSETTATGDYPTPLQGHSALVGPTGDTIYVYGGADASNPDNYYSDIYILNTTTLAWTHVNATGTIPQARAWHSAVMAGNKMLIFFGAGIGDNFNDTNAFDLATMGWTTSYPGGTIPPISYVPAIASTTPTATLFSSSIPPTTSTTASSTASSANELGSTILSAIGGWGGVAGMAAGGVVLFAALLFCCYRFGSSNQKRKARSFHTDDFSRTSSSHPMHDMRHGYQNGSVGRSFANMPPDGNGSLGRAYQYQNGSVGRSFANNSLSHVNGTKYLPILNPPNSPYSNQVGGSSSTPSLTGRVNPYAVQKRLRQPSTQDEEANFPYHVSYEDSGPPPSSPPSRASDIQFNSVPRTSPRAPPTGPLPQAPSSRSPTPTNSTMPISSPAAHFASVHRRDQRAPIPSFDPPQPSSASQNSTRPAMPSRSESPNFSTWSAHSIAHESIAEEDENDLEDTHSESTERGMIR